MKAPEGVGMVGAGVWEMRLGVVGREPRVGFAGGIPGEMGWLIARGWPSASGRT
jgi:hypothetical protein